MNPGRLQGKSAVITGGSGTLGRAMARVFVREGGHVLLVDLDARSLEEACRELGDAASFVMADVTQPVIGGLIRSTACFALIDTPPEPDS